MTVADPAARLTLKAVIVAVLEVTGCGDQHDHDHDSRDGHGRPPHDPHGLRTPWEAAGIAVMTESPGFVRPGAAPLRED